MGAVRRAVAFSAVPVVLVLVSFVLMEPAAYLIHRFVMHGRLGAWHHSHHQVRTATFEANDLYLSAPALTLQPG